MEKMDHCMGLLVFQSSSEFKIIALILRGKSFSNFQSSSEFKDHIFTGVDRERIVIFQSSSEFKIFLTKTKIRMIDALSILF